MKNQEIIEGNMLIVEFMGYNCPNSSTSSFYIEDHNRVTGMNGRYDFTDHWYTLEEVEYYTSWDWLIPVIDKITSMQEYPDFKIHTSFQFHDGGIYINTKYIENTWEQVVEFIKWYNEIYKV